MNNNNQKAIPWPNPVIGWYAVAILLVAMVFSFIDRIVIALLVEPIKADLGLSDTQIGFLQGFAFALFYTLVGLPIGRLADRHSRRLIVGVGIFLWSVMTAVCGLARSFWQLFLARVGVGVGEATLSPSAYSMISDYFPRERLGRAIGVYQSGGIVGAGLAFLVGGAVIQWISTLDTLSFPMVGTLQPWQLTFMTVGLPGVLVAMLMFTVKEPVRRGVLGDQPAVIPVREVTRYVTTRWRAFGLHFVGFALLSTPIAIAFTWAPTMFIRKFGYSAPDVAYGLGLLLLIFASTGTVFGGWLCDALKRRGYEDATLRVGIIAVIALLPLSIATSLVNDDLIVIILFCPYLFFATLAVAAAPAAIQLITPNQMRAQISAAWMLFLNLLSATAGPTAVGIYTDYIFKSDDAISYSMALANVLALPLSGLCLWLGLRPFRETIAERTTAETA